MGGRSRAVTVLTSLGALGLLTACGIGTSASPAWVPRPSTYTSLSTTDPQHPSDPRRPDGPGFVDPRVAEPPAGLSSRTPVFLWSQGAAPSTPFGEVDRESLERLVATDRWNLDDRMEMAAALTLPSPRDARAVARRLRTELPPEATRYPGRHDAVVVLGSTVVVRGIPDGRAKRLVLALLPGHRGQVLVEGDRYGEGAIVTDVSCRPTDRAKAEVVARDLADYAIPGGIFFLRPPWVGPRLDDAERLARATYRRFNETLEDAVAADPESQELWDSYRQALGTGDADRMNALQRRMGERRRELSPARLEGEYDPVTLTALRSQPLEPKALGGWAARVGGRMGQLPITRRAGEFVQRRGRAFTGEQTLLYARLARRLDIASFLPVGNFTSSLATLVLYLDREGCADVRYRLLDWDEVRGD